MARTLPAPLRILRRIVRHYREERCAQVAAALAFTTVLALVPLLAVTLAVASQLPYFDGLGRTLETFLVQNVLPPKSGAVVARHLAQFSQKATGLTVAGIGTLALTALMLLLTIDKTFNEIWRVSAQRPLWKRLIVYSVIMVAGPLLMAAALGAVTFAVSKGFGWLGEPAWVRAATFRVVAFVFVAAVLALLYYAVPNRMVPARHAIGGALLAALLLTGLQRLLALYVSAIPTFSVVYGAFSALPVLLLWLYLAWLTVLIGAVVAAVLGERAPVSSGRGRAGSGTARGRRSGDRR